MSVEKLRIRIIEINRPINKVEGSIKEIYRHFKIHPFDASVEFKEEEISGFKTARVTFFNIGSPLYLGKSFPEIFPECEDIEERKEDSPEDFVDFILDNISRDKFFDILGQRFEVDVKLLSVEKKMPVIWL